MKVNGTTDRMDVILDTETKEIDVTQSWHFQFCPHPTETAREMNHESQKLFKLLIQMTIRMLWDNKAHLELVSTTDPKLLPYVGTVFNLRVGIKEVSMADAAQWKVIVTRENIRNHVIWETRTIKLNTDVIDDKTHTNRRGIRARQNIPAHEFGHAFGNTSRLSSIGMTGDEYHAYSPHFPDTESIMNIGNSVRKRHYEYVRYILEVLVIPGTVFKTELR